jgi:AraC-like DNA-binding protein
MGVQIRVEDEPPRTRLDYLRHVLAEHFVPYGLRIDADRNLRGQISTGPVGTVYVTNLSFGTPLEAFRTRRLIRGSDPELFKIDVQVRGPAVIAQGNREAALAPGDFTLVDLSRPCEVAEPGDDHEAVVVTFPRAALPLRHDELDRLTAVPISGREGLGAPISALARHIGRHRAGYDPTERARLATALMDLLIVALAGRLDRGATIAPDTRRRALLASVQAFIEQRLGDTRLSPSAIAAAHHISIRYLYKLFETQETSVAGWIRQRRLERCRRDLLDPALADWSVTAIAARWGLTNAAHFSHLFRAAYGLPPAKYRLAERASNPR